MLVASLVLSSRDILDNILQYSDLRNLPGFALVCKDWLEPALTFIWAELEDSTALSRLLLPTRTFRRKEGEPQAHRLRDQCWERFTFYARNFRALTMVQGLLSNFFGLKHHDKRQKPVFSALYVALSKKGVTKDDLFPRLNAVHICVEGWGGFRPDHQTVLLPLTSRLEVLTIKYHGAMNIDRPRYAPRLERESI